MINAIRLLKMAAHDMRNISTPNSQTITEYAANQNKKMAEEYELAAQLLVKAQNAGFAEGWLEGINKWCKEREGKTFGSKS